MEYSDAEVQLVVLVVEIQEGDEDKVLTAVVVAPFDSTCGDDDHVTTADSAHLLVLVFLFASANSTPQTP